MGEIWKAIVGLLLSGGPLLAVQLGGRRGLARQAIREELELIKLLGEEHAAVRARLSRRIDKRLEQYEPGEDARTRRRQGTLLAAAEFVVLTAAAVAILIVFDVESSWTSAAIGAAVGAVGAVGHAIIASRLDKREQDRAVAKGSLEATLPHVVADMHGRVEASHVVDRGE